MNTRFSDKLLRNDFIMLPDKEAPNVKKPSSGDWFFLTFVVMLLGMSMLGGMVVMESRRDFNKLAESMNGDREKIQHLMNCISQLEKDNWALEKRLKKLEAKEVVEVRPIENFNGQIFEALEKRRKEAERAAGWKVLDDALDDLKNQNRARMPKD